MRILTPLVNYMIDNNNDNNNSNNNNSRRSRLTAELNSLEQAIQ